MDGVININKPAGMTSFDVVARVKRLTGQRHCGHAGTLDPQATGVLPVCLGQATRVVEYLFDETKKYQAVIRMGITTDTYDSTGKVIEEKDASQINPEQIKETLKLFHGTITQIPPMYSALKYNGKPLYKLARTGIEVERESRPVRIDNLQIIDWQPPLLTLDIVCGKGTYIRSLAHDLGQKLGCGASMQNLARLRVGPFKIEEALTLPQMEEIAKSGDWQPYLFPLDYVLMDFPVLVVNEAQRCSLIHGSPVSLSLKASPPATSIEDNQLCRVYTEDGSFLGMVRYQAENQRWQPEKIFWQKCCQQ
jgi:tRNA pseudouridine55 synthase